MVSDLCVGRGGLDVSSRYTAGRRAEVMDGRVRMHYYKPTDEVGQRGDELEDLARVLQSWEGRSCQRLRSKHL